MAAEYRIATRLLRRSDGGPALEWVEAMPGGPRLGPPILFLHGLFGGAWVWGQIFLPFFSRRGRRAGALSLRGHAGSEGRDGLAATGLADYRADLGRAFAEFPEPPVVVAHCLGGLLAQLAVGRAQMRGLVLLASLPPDDGLSESLSSGAAGPLVRVEACLRGFADADASAIQAAQQVFSEGLPRERAARYLSTMTPEPVRALADARHPGPVVSALIHRLPTLVIGGSRDRLVPPVSTLRTAFFHAAEHGTAEGMGHFLPLDAGAEDLAARVLGWLSARDL